MTVNELIEQLQACDRPDDEVQLRLIDSLDFITQGEPAEIYYASVTAKIVVIEGDAR